MQQITQCVNKLMLVCHLHAGTGGDKFGGDSLEVLHVRPKHHRMPTGGGLDDVLAAHTHQTLAYKNNGGDVVKQFQLADSTYQQTIPISYRRAAIAQREFDILALRQLDNLWRAFDMPGHEHEE